MKNEKLPVMRLDKSMPVTYLVPIHPESGEIWKEKQDEILELATELRYEIDEDLREKYRIDLDAAKAGVSFESHPLIMMSSYIFGKAFAGIVPRIQYHCHPDTWADIPDSDKSKFEMIIDEDYFFLSKKDKTIEFFKQDGEWKLLK
jgi:hypothetical protein